MRSPEPGPIGSRVSGLAERLLIGLVAANLAVLLADLLYNLIGALGGLTPAP